MKLKLEKIILARHYGFCMGVKRAIQIAEETGAKGDGPVNVFNEIVHNDAVVERMVGRGIGFVTNLEQAPGGTVIVSAHGAPPLLFDEARRRGLRVVDATCPLVIRIHKTIHGLIERGYEIIHFGDRDHDETIGVVGQAPSGRVHVVRAAADLQALPRNGRRYALTAQTTAGVKEFEEISRAATSVFPDIEVFNTICNATAQRQAAVLRIAPLVDLMLVVGSASSANSNRLRHISEAACGRAYLIDSADDLDLAWLADAATVGLTAGASTPDFLVEDVITRLVELSGGKAQVVRDEPRRRSPSRPRRGPKAT
jgi:(E)-4-hydroxy-3-methyl-but-2-enyl pyrophosphate reductase